MSESGGFLQSVSNFSFGDLIDYDCPVYGNNSDFIIEQATFWIEGVALTAVATFGVLGNILASIILSRPELRWAIWCSFHVSIDTFFQLWETFSLQKFFQPFTGGPGLVRHMLHSWFHLGDCSKKFSCSFAASSFPISLPTLPRPNDCSNRIGFHDCGYCF